MVTYKAKIKTNGYVCSLTYANLHSQVAVIVEGGIIY